MRKTMSTPQRYTSEFHKRMSKKEHPDSLDTLRTQLQLRQTRVNKPRPAIRSTGRFMYDVKDWD